MYDMKSEVKAEKPIRENNQYVCPCCGNVITRYNNNLCCSFCKQPLEWPQKTKHKK